MCYLVVIPLARDPEPFYYHASITPTVTMSWWANQGDLYAEQEQDMVLNVKDMSRKFFCDASGSQRPKNGIGTKARATELTEGNNIFDTDTSCSSSLDGTPTASEEYWFEADHTCQPLTASEMYEKGENTFFFMTYFMRTYARDVSCAAESVGCSSLGLSFRRLNAFRCQCYSKTSHFTPGVEGMQLGMKIGITETDPKIDIKKSDWFASSPRCVLFALNYCVCPQLLFALATVCPQLLRLPSKTICPNYCSPSTNSKHLGRGCYQTRQTSTLATKATPARAARNAFASSLPARMRSSASASG